MNKHIFLDNLITVIGGMFGEKVRFFRESIESPSVKELIGNTVIKLPELKGEGEYRVEANVSGQEIEAFFKVTQWKGIEYPTIVFHHGSGDQPYYSRVNGIIPPGDNTIQANVIAVGAPFNTSKNEYIKQLGHLRNFALLLAVCTVLTEELVQWLKGKGCPRVVVSGISLGGWTTNLHHTYFNTADQYRPMLAGAAPEDVFFTNSYRKMVSRNVKGKRDIIQRVLNFEDDFEKAHRNNVFPLMARYDQYIIFDRQSRCYKPENVTVVDKGHITAAMDSELLRQHLVGGLT